MSSRNKKVKKKDRNRKKFFETILKIFNTLVVLNLEWVRERREEIKCGRKG